VIKRRGFRRVVVTVSTVAALAVPGVLGVSAPAWADAYDPPNGCTVNDATHSKDIYKRYHREICQAARNAGIDPILVAITVTHEGEGREKYFSSTVGKTAEYASWLSGANHSIGIGQMQPEAAVGLMNKYIGEPGMVYYTNKVDEAAAVIVEDTSFAIQLAAYYLKDLRDTYGFDDKQAFIAYAFPLPALYGDLVRTNFQGPQASGRWNKFDKLEAEIRTHSGHWTGQTPNQLKYAADTPTAALPTLF
jgi:hypothetical protein